MKRTIVGVKLFILALNPYLRLLARSLAMMSRDIFPFFGMLSTFYELHRGPRLV